MRAGLIANGAETAVALTPVGVSDDTYSMPAILEDGSHVVVYRTLDGQVVQRAYDADGVPKGAAEVVASAPGVVMDAPGVMALDTGGHAVYWTREGPAGDRVQIQIYDDAGQPVGGVRSISGPVAQIGDTSATLRGDGVMVIAWTQDVGGTSLARARLIREDGSFLGPVRDLSTNSSNGQADIDIAALKGGKIALTWEEDSLSFLNKDDIKLQVYDKSMTTTGAVKTANTVLAGDHSDPVVTGLQGGGYVVSWWGAHGLDGDQWGVFARVYDDTGQAVGDEIQVNTTFENVQASPDVIGLEGGGFLVVWQSFAQDGSGDTVVAQRFDADGTLMGDEFVVNSSTHGWQTLPGLAADRDGNLVISWQSQHVDNAQWQITTQSFVTPLIGTDGDDVLRDFKTQNLLFGLDGKDSLFGLNGNDLIEGGDGRDRLVGGQGRDSLDGGRGADVLVGGDGNDQLTGGNGADVFVFSALQDHERDIVHDFTIGVDSLRINGSSFAMTTIQAQGATDTRVILESGTEIILRDVLSTDLSASDFDFV